MPRTKAESTADAVEEQKTDAVEDTAPVQAEEPKAPAESEYTIEELADGAGNIFKVQRECVVAALKVAGVTTISPMLPMTISRVVSKIYGTHSNINVHKPKEYT